MSLGRISKLFAAQNATQVVSLLTQLLLPPIFLHSYGVGLSGEWLALSAAIGYLSTVNYGIQTYTNMQMTIHYNRGEVDECVRLQSGGLFILLVIFVALAILLCCIFFIPIDAWLHMQLPLREAQSILYLLSLQVLVGMVFGFFSGNYMVIGSAHRGTNFANLNLLLGTLVSAALALAHSRLLWIAAAQFVVAVLMTGYLFIDFSRLAPALRPTLRHWRKTSLRGILKPSGHYALLYSSNILGYQLPVIVIQRILGPIAVVTFSVTRTIYSMSRRLPSLVTNSIGPEVTITFGERNWKKMNQLYELSERLVLLLIAPVTFGAMLFTPLLLVVWLRKGSLYDPWVCLLFGVTIAIQSVKEHKYQFQFSTNQVRELAYMTPIAYGCMLLLSIPAMMWLGLPGMLAVWAIAEAAQLLYLLELNRQLFGAEARLSFRLVGVLMLLLVAEGLACIWPVFHIASMSLPKQALIASTVTLLSLAISYWIFGVDEIRTMLWQRIRSSRLVVGNASQ
jgi:O-antigen/teichoic acid export membrane protein